MKRGVGGTIKYVVERYRINSKKNKDQVIGAMYSIKEIFFSQNNCKIIQSPLPQMSAEKDSLQVSSMRRTPHSYPVGNHYCHITGTFPT